VPRVTLNGASLECSESGSGPPVILVHGSASDHRTWDGQIPALAERFRVVAYSRRYHWPNDPIPDGADYSMPEHTQDLLTLVRSLDAGPVHLVGHSYGAFVCLLAALEDPALARSLVLAEPPAITLFVSNTPKPGEILKLAATRPRTAVSIVKSGAGGAVPAAKAAERGDREAMMRHLGHATLGRGPFDRLSEARREQVRANLIKAELTGSGFAPLDDARLRGLRIPTLLMSAERSPALFDRLIDRLEELLPETTRVRIPEASHIMHEDNPGAYRKAVLGFLTSLS
jgi:pimeloyl-ACP methyl ester carboxylesterase